MNLLRFIQNDKDREWQDEVVVSKRLVDDNGKPIKFRISSMSGEEYDRYQQAATKIDAKRKDVSYSASKYRRAVIINHTIEPSFKDAEAIKAAGLATPEQYLNAALRAGEQNRLFQAITALSGFDESMDDLVDEAKNS